MIKLYDLAAKNTEVRFSPYCWLVKTVLHYKGIEFDTIPCHFTEKEKLPIPNEGKVPVITNGKDVVNDSWKIVQYIEQIYSNNAVLDKSNETFALFIRNWAEYFLHPAIGKVIIPNLYKNVLADCDKPYFRETREGRLKMTFEQLEKSHDNFRNQLKFPLAFIKKTLGENKFLLGNKPFYGDFVIFGALKWLNYSLQGSEVFKYDDVILNYFNRLEQFTLK